MIEPPAISRRSFLRQTAATATALALSGCDTHLHAADGQRTTDNRQRLTVYSWSDIQHRGIIPMTWQPMDRAGDALALSKPIPGTFEGNPVELIAHGPKNLVRWRTWMVSYFQRFHPAPRWIVLDVEDNALSYGNIRKRTPVRKDRIAAFQAIWNDPNAYAKLPDVVKQFAPDDFADGAARSREAVNAWQDFVAKLRADALRTVVYEPAVQVFGDGVACGNYWDMDYDFPVYNSLGWPIPRRWMGNWSCPSCYLRTVGGHFAHCKMSAPWNSFIDDLNYVRSCLNCSSRVAPWISYPSFHEGNPMTNLWQQRWLWRELVKHIRASGIDTLLWWNPTNLYPAWENTLAFQSFTAPAPVAARQKFAAINHDAQEVITGPTVTRYEDWQRATTHDAVRGGQAALEGR